MPDSYLRHFRSFASHVCDPEITDSYPRRLDSGGHRIQSTKPCAHIHHNDNAARRLFKETPKKNLTNLHYSIPSPDIGKGTRERRKEGIEGGSAEVKTEFVSVCVVGVGLSLPNGESEMQGNEYEGDRSKSPMRAGPPI